MSSVTFLMVACSNFCCGWVPSTSVGSFEDNSHSPAWFSVISRAPDAREKARNAFDAAGAPGFHLLQRPHEHFVAAKRVCAVLVDHFVGVNDVPARFRHFLVVFAEDDSLVHESLKRLGLRDVAKVEQHLLPETRVEQVQHSMLGSSYVQVDATRVYHRPSSNVPLLHRRSG